ncbi:MAG: VOC family protein [Saprospiraceae bacterium]|nr:VOC family protein [Saprospiraceae bacterium]
MSNRITHFEIPCDDPEKTMTFFSDVFGWSFKRFGNEAYWLVKTGKDGDFGINGAISKKRDPQQPITNSITIIDIDLTLTEIEKSGGVIVLPKTPVPQMGWFAFFKDPDGNIHGLWQDDKNASS